MTVPSTTARNDYTSPAPSAPLPFTFPIFTASALQVLSTDIATGAQSTLVQGVDYNLPGTAWANGGSISPLATWATGKIYTLRRVVPLTQQLDMRNQGAYFAEDQERALDLLTEADQQQQDQLDRSLKLPAGEVGTAANATLPPNRAGKYLAFDLSQNPICLPSPAVVTSILDINLVQVVDTIASLRALPAPIGNVQFLVRGYYAIGDGGGGMFAWAAASAVADNLGTVIIPNASPASGRWLRITSSLLSFAWFGAKGDGTTNDLAALQAAISYVSSAGGGLILGERGKVYRCDINSGISDKGLIIGPGVVLSLNGCTLQLRTTGDVYGCRLRSGAQIVGPGTVDVQYQSGATSSQTIFHSAVSVGCAYSDGGGVGTESIYEGQTDWACIGVTLKSSKTTAAAFDCQGGGGNGLVERCAIPDSATLLGGIHLDWGSIGNVQSAASNVGATRTLFDAGTAYTTHPHDIVIRGNRIGILSGSATYGIRLSGVHNVKVLDNEIAGTTYAGFYHTSGDIGYEFALAAVKPFRHRGVEVRNTMVRNANNGWGFYWDSWSDNITGAVSGFAYSPRLDDVQRPDALIEGCRTFSNGGALVQPGFRLQYVIGMEVRNCCAEGHLNGCLIETNSDGVVVVGGSFDNNRNSGINVNGTVVPLNVVIDGVHAYGNGTDAGYGTPSGIELVQATRPIVRRCILGKTGEANQMYGVKAVSSQVFDAVIADNVTIALKAAGIAYLIGLSTTYTTLRQFTGNQGGAAATFYAGQNIIPRDQVVGTDGLLRGRFSALRAVLSAGNTPNAGTWRLGDIIEYLDPITADFIGTTCIAAGSPGTWRRFGATT